MANRRTAAQWLGCGLSILVWASPLGATQTPRSVLWLQVEAGEDQAAVSEAVRRVVAASERYQLLDRTARLDACCTETACWVADMLNKGAAGTLVVRVARDHDDVLVVAKILFPTLRGTPRSFALTEGEPEAVAAAVVAELLKTAPPKAGKHRTAILPVQVEAPGRWPAEIFNEVVVASLAGSGSVDPVGQGDIDDLIGSGWRLPPLAGKEANERCKVIDSEALQVDFIVVMKIAALGSDYVISSKLIDIAATTVKAKVNRIARRQTSDLVKTIGEANGELIDNAGLR